MQWIDAVVQDGQHAVRLHNDLEYFAENNLKLSGSNRAVCL
jgi:hypothetical protein